MRLFFEFVRVLGAAILTPLLGTAVHAQDIQVVRGRVISDDGVAVADAQVTTEAVMLRSDFEGRFVLRLAGCDTVRVTARRLGFRPASRSIVPCTWATVDTLVIALERAPVALATDTVTAELSGIRGVVESSDGSPVAGAEVTAYHLGRAERGRTVLADYEGRFALLDLEPGAALLRIRHRRMQVVSRGVLLERAVVKEIGVTMPALAEGAKVDDDPSGYGVDEGRFLDMARRQQARPTASALLTQEQLRATGERNLGCAVTKVPGVTARLLAGISRRSSRGNIDLPLFEGGCLGPVCVVDDGRRMFEGGRAILTKDVEYVEIYIGDFPVQTVELRGCAPPMLVVWWRKHEGW